MIRVLIFDTNRRLRRTGDLELLHTWQPAKGEWAWLDSDGTDPDTERTLFIDRFGLNDLAVTDIQRDRHPPKFEAFEQHMLLILRELTRDSVNLDYRLLQTSFVIGRSFLITRHNGRSPAVDTYWPEGVKLHRGPTHMAYRLARHIVDRYTPILLAIDDRLDELEEQIFENADDALLSELVGYNSRLKRLRRVLSYTKNVFGLAKQHQPAFMHKLSRHEFNDLFENFDRLDSMANLHQELVQDLINSFLSLSSHRLNKIMKTLTIVTAIFLPMTLLAGIYGMNFDWMPELRWRYGYFAALAGMGLIALTAILVLRRLKWL